MRVPWYVRAVLVAATSAVVGVIWDISWHRTIGRDTFWTPAHLAIYASGVIAGLSCGWLVLQTTFAGSDADRAATVRFWGFRGPLGAWCCIWGALAMIVSAPFDNWWHNAYGLDVKVLSPPHVILALGFTGIELGAVLLVLALQNRTKGVDRSYGLLLAYGFGILILNMAIMGFEQIGFPNAAHNALYYLVAAAIFPMLLVAGARASTLPWAATTAAIVYMGITLILVWILPLFPATPKLAPVYRPVSHMVSPPFPLILIVPALVIDVLMRRVPSGAGGARRDWVLAATTGLGFLAVFFVTQWFATVFLISPASEHLLFGVNRWNYNSPPGAFEHQFWDVAADPVTPLKLGIAALLAFASARAGLWLGRGLARVQR